MLALHNSGADSGRSSVARLMLPPDVADALYGCAGERPVEAIPERRCVRARARRRHHGFDGAAEGFAETWTAFCWQLARRLVVVAVVAGWFVAKAPPRRRRRDNAGRRCAHVRSPGPTRREVSHRRHHRRAGDAHRRCERHSCGDARQLHAIRSAQAIAARDRRPTRGHAYPHGQRANPTAGPTARG